MTEVKTKSTPLAMLLVGPLLMAITLLTPVPFEGMSESAWHTLGLAVWMATWWVSEATPVAESSNCLLTFNCCTCG